jgi:hypothetical protein
MNNTALLAETTETQDESLKHLNLVTRCGKFFRHPVLVPAQELISTFFFGMLNTDQEEILIDSFKTNQEEIDFEKFALEIEAHIELYNSSKTGSSVIGNEELKRIIGDSMM